MGGLITLMIFIHNNRKLKANWENVPFQEIFCPSYDSLATKWRSRIETAGDPCTVRCSFVLYFPLTNFFACVRDEMKPLFSWIHVLLCSSSSLAVSRTQMRTLRCGLRYTGLAWGLCSVHRRRTKRCTEPLRAPPPVTLTHHPFLCFLLLRNTLPRSTTTGLTRSLLPDFTSSFSQYIFKSHSSRASTCKLSLSSCV